MRIRQDNNWGSLRGQNCVFVVVVQLYLTWTFLAILRTAGTVPLGENSGSSSTTKTFLASASAAGSAKPLALPQIGDRETGASVPSTSALTHSGTSRQDNPELTWAHDEHSGETFTFTNFCTIGASLEKVVCRGLKTVKTLEDLPFDTKAFRTAVFIDIANGSAIRLRDLQRTFPNLRVLTIVQSSEMVTKFLKQMSHAAAGAGVENNSLNFKAGSPDFWPSVEHLNLSRNELNSDTIPSNLMTFFPNLQELDLAGNNISTLSNISPMDWARLTSIDLSENPLDCTSDEIEWIESPNITLLNINQTLCDLPPHQNKPKPILQTIHLIKKVKAECRLNCSCQIDYIWELDKVVHSKTSVNCTNRNFIDFPDPDQLPVPTDTLYLNDNKISSIKKFVEDHKYTALNVKNLYLDNNQISSIEPFESSDWIYTFQMLSLRRNNLSEVPIHLLENIFRQNKWVYFIDLSGNKWTCDCRTLSTFKVWLLRHSKFVKNIENVKCGKTGQEIRYLKNEDWCKREEVSQMIELLDCLSIFLALLILLVITKVVYDYWKLKKYGKIPWIVSKM